MGWEPTELRSLPRAGLAVSALGRGTTAIGGLFEATSDAAAQATLAAAVAAGLRYFDTAPQYGHGLAEQRVGQALRALDHDRFDLLLIHDVNRKYHGERVDERFRKAMAGAFPALAELRRAIEEVCARHGVARAAAALQFPLAHPAVASVVAGMRSPGELEANLWLLRAPIAGAFWGDLKRTGLLPDAAAVPAG